MTVDAGGIGPIGFHRHDVEAMPLDQAARDGGPGAIELGGAMGGFAQQHHARFTEAVEGGAELGMLRRRPPLAPRRAQRFDERRRPVPHEIERAHVKAMIGRPARFRQTGSRRRAKSRFAEGFPRAYILASWLERPTQIWKRRR